MKRISDKQKIKNAHWKKVSDEKAEELHYRCQWCGKKGVRDPKNWRHLNGHHIIPRRFNIHTKKNCYIVHQVICHGFIDDWIDVTKYPSARDLEGELLERWNKFHGGWA